MIEKQEFNELELHFMSEDLRKMILYCMKKSKEETKKEGRNFFDNKVAQRKNLYIYPAKDSV